MNDSPQITPPLKWAGGKRWLVPMLRKLLAAHKDKRFVEPFAGGLAAALGLHPQEALLNDANPHLINFYNQVQSGLKSDLAMKNDREYYNQLRDRFNSLVRQNLFNTKEAALIFYFLNRTGFNGLCRFNSKGEFNVPFGSYKKINYVEDFSAYQEIFSQWKFTCSDFESLAIREDDVLYIDPPYDVEFTKYSKEDFKWEDQVRLIDWLSGLQNPQIVSNQATERILKLYKKAGFEIVQVSAPRRIAANGNRSNAMEIIATKKL